MPPCASSKRPIFCAMAPVNAPFLVAEQLALEQARGNRRAVQLDEGARATAAQVVDRAGDQLLAGPRLALNQDRRVGRRDDLDLLERLLERRALADDLVEVLLGSNFLLEIELLGVQLLLQLRDLPIRQPILDGDGDLLRDLTQQLDVVCVECIRPDAARRSALRARDRATGAGQQQNDLTPSARTRAAPSIRPPALLSPAR